MSESGNERRILRLRRRRRYYIDWGGSGRSLVLLGGLGGAAQLYRGLARRLTKRFRVAALARRVRSDRPESGYDLDILVEDIRRFLDELVIDREGLAGHSFAGIEMPYLALRWRDTGLDAGAVQSGR